MIQRYNSLGANPFQTNVQFEGRDGRAQPLPLQFVSSALLGAPSGGADRGDMLGCPQGAAIASTTVLQPQDP